MACFVAPLGEAILTSVIKHTALSRIQDEGKKSAWKERITALEQLLYGGSIVLAAEHVYHGELVFYPPFLTAMKNPADIPAMLHEIATAGTAMAVVVTAAWGLLCALALKKKPRFAAAARVALGTLLMFAVDGLFAVS